MQYENNRTTIDIGEQRGVISCLCVAPHILTGLDICTTVEFPKLDLLFSKDTWNTNIMLVEFVSGWCTTHLAWVESSKYMYVLKYSLVCSF